MPMGFSEAEKRIQRLTKAEKSGKVKNRVIKNNLIQSYKNHVKLGEGDAGVREIDKVTKKGSKYTTIKASDWERIFGNA